MRNKRQNHSGNTNGRKDDRCWITMSDEMVLKRGDGMTENCTNKEEVAQYFHQDDIQELDYENKRGFPRRTELHGYYQKG